MTGVEVRGKKGEMGGSHGFMVGKSPMNGTYISSRVQAV